MDNPAQDMELRQSSSQEPRMTLSTAGYRGLRQVSKPETRSQRLERFELRIQQLHNRRLLLLRMEDMKRKAATWEDCGETGELESVENELQELQVKKKALAEQGESSTLTEDGGQQGKGPPFYKMETPCGGIYMLPPMTQEEVGGVEKVKQTTPAAEMPTDPITPADSLGDMSAFTRCPSCEEFVVTETHSTVGDTVWLLCCMCSMMGCVAGCCLIPFFMKSLRNVHHRCPGCRATIHTHQPM